MYADAIRRQAEDAPRAALPAVAAALWKAFASGLVSEAEAEVLSALIEVRRTAGRPSAEPAGVKGGTEPPGAPDLGGARQTAPGRPRTAAGARPVSGASLERRRRWAASGRLPPGLAVRFTLAEQAVLALVAAETVQRKDCRLAIEHIAAVAGVARSTVKNALREARKLGLVTVEERRLTGFRNDTNVVRIVSAEWAAWLRLARKPAPAGTAPALPLKGGGVKSATGTHTQVQIRGKPRPAEPSQRLPGGSGRPEPIRARQNPGGR